MSEIKLQRLQIIFDTDHGPANEGWYVRMRERDELSRPGGMLDEPVDLSIKSDSMGCLTKRQESALRGEARRVARRNGYRIASSFPVEIA